MKKQILSLILALAMVLSMSVCAFAADENTITKKDGTAEVPLNGEIMDNKDIALISVVVPTSIDFQIGTEAMAGVTDITVAKIGENDSNNLTVGTSGRKFVQLVSGTGTVTNNTQGNAIKLEISKVADDASNPLLSKVNLALAPASTADAATAMASYKLTAGDSSIVLSNSMATGDTLDLKVFGQGAEGTYSGTSYPVNLPDGTATVTVTLKVSLADAT